MSVGTGALKANTRVVVVVDALVLFKALGITQTN